MDEMDKESPGFPLRLILRELDDIKRMIYGISDKMDDHLKHDDERFGSVDLALANWKGMAVVAVAIISALVSVIVGLVVKHF